MTTLSLLNLPLYVHIVHKEAYHDASTRYSHY
jgi:hypothetical protein